MFDSIIVIHKGKAMFHHTMSMLHRAKAHYARCTSISDVILVSKIIAAASVREFLGLDCFSNLEFKWKAVYGHRLMKQYIRKDHYDFNGILMPRFAEHEYRLACALYLSVTDVLFAYLNNNDRYDKEFVEKSDIMTSEGLYCYKDEHVDLTIKEGMVVLDLGSCFGEFSAYSAKKGAIAYAFEPLASNRAIIEKTIELNKNLKGTIMIVPCGVDSKSGEKLMRSAADCSAIVSGSISAENERKEFEAVELVSLDDWTEKENIKVDFIKADIEGFERHMLEGAMRVLREQKPILSLCTYHHPDDSKIMQDLILKGNPKYRIIQRRMKLLAYVPEC